MNKSIFTDNQRDMAEHELKHCILSNNLSYKQLEDFLGYPISAEILDNLETHLDDVLCQMPDDELIEFCKTYHIQYERHTKCKFCHHCMGRRHNEIHCVSDGWEDDKVKIITKETCETCDKYTSKFIEYPITINGINNQKIKSLSHHPIGSLCKIRPCDEQYQNKTYLGIYLGNLPISITTSLNKDGILTNQTLNNPAIFVPELKKIIYGCESWWSEIKNSDELKDISDDDINNQWYVQLLKSM